MFLTAAAALVAFRSLAIELILFSVTLILLVSFFFCLYLCMTQASTSIATTASNVMLAGTTELIVGVPISLSLRPVVEEVAVVMVEGLVLLDSRFVSIIVHMCLAGL